MRALGSTPLTLLVVFVVLQVLDVATTLAGLSLGLAEQNPLAAAVFGAAGATPGVLFVKVYAVGLIIVALYRAQQLAPARFLHWQVLAAADVLYCGVVANNLWAIGEAL